VIVPIVTRDRNSPSLTSYLFTVRVWREELEEGHIEWRGKVQYALTGEARYFRQWEDLIAFFRAQIENVDGADMSAEK